MVLKAGIRRTKRMDDSVIYEIFANLRDVKIELAIHGDAQPIDAESMKQTCPMSTSLRLFHAEPCLVIEPIFEEGTRHEWSLHLKSYELTLLTALLNKYPTDAEKRQLTHVFTELSECQHRGGHTKPRHDYSVTVPSWDITSHIDHDFTLKKADDEKLVFICRSCNTSFDVHYKKIG